MRHLIRFVFVLAIAGLVSVGHAQGLSIPNLLPFLNPAGAAATFTTAGSIDLNNPFFQPLGTNGRACITCHLPDQGWSLSAQNVQARFVLTGGLDPIFRTVDGSVCDHGISTDTVAQRSQAYSLLTSRGLIRIALDVPANAQFEVTAVSNPYGCNETSTLSMYRRPLPSTNLRALSTVMWDGRESTPPSTEKITFATNPGDLLFDLAHQAVDATLGHAQAEVPPTVQQQQDIVNLETSFSTAQIFDRNAGLLNAFQAKGGPAALSAQPFYVGINDSLGGDPMGGTFTPVIFTLFQPWSSLRGNAPGTAARESIARGEALFNSKAIQITGVAGLNDDLGKPLISGTCGTCHDAPNFGNHSLSVPLNIGVADLTNPLGVGYLPMITLTNKQTGAVVTTTDPGRAMTTGLWKDIGKVKGPVLRTLASRAPYFHNGSAKTLMDVINFYDVRFQIGFTAAEKQDLAAFLGAL